MTYKLKCCRGIWCNVWKWKNPSSRAFCVSFLTFLAGTATKVHAFDCESPCFPLRLCARILCSPFTPSSSHMADVDFCRLCGKMAVKVRIPFLNYLNIFKETMNDCDQKCCRRIWCNVWICRMSSLGLLQIPFSHPHTVGRRRKSTLSAVGGRIDYLR